MYIPCHFHDTAVCWRNTVTHVCNYRHKDNRGKISYPNTESTHCQEASIVSLSVLSHEAPDGEAGCAEGLTALHNGKAPGHRHVVYHPLMHVVLVDDVSE